MRLVRADTLPLDELAALFTRGYEGYAIPFRVDEAALRFFVDAWDLDLSRSLVALDGAVPVGLVNIGVRGDRGWIGGLGVVPEARRRGVGRMLMEAVLEQAPPTVALEVLEQNEAALRLYEQLGFRRTRVLEVWSVQAPEAEARRGEPRPLGQPDLPWQREDASLPPEYDCLEVDGGTMLLRGTNVLQLAASDVAAAKALLSRGTTLQYVNVPEGDVASVALRELGATPALRQFELVRRA